MQVRDTTAIVTGGASGLGAATASALAGEGATVIVLDLPAAIEQAPEVAVPRRPQPHGRRVAAEERGGVSRRPQPEKQHQMNTSHPQVSLCAVFSTTPVVERDSRS